ncbi:polysaccharide deacetylase family protein [Aegicerativicinus sediminis]|uniref:polysaccharide deacetylase family protein n=1 Tax=Aegicerativicinus sediminis TaxID=2893202 RepID=UPI001E42EFAE|nr:polysaccharide deacetylase family protein [Aegicerativicinus sediminis]
MNLILVFLLVPKIWWWILPVLVLVFISLSAFNSQWNVFLKTITHKETRKKVVAITFDDGPDPEITPKVLKQLEKHKAKATFFCIGKNIVKHPEIIQTQDKLGNEIANHSYFHGNFIDFHNSVGWIKEIIKTDQAVETSISKRPNYFRAPYGVTTPHLARALKTTGHQIIGWSIRSYDTFINNPYRIFTRIKKRIHPGAIILLHDTNERCPVVLEQLLIFLKEEGYRTVTVKELLNET